MKVNEVYHLLNNERTVCIRRDQNGKMRPEAPEPRGQLPPLPLKHGGAWGQPVALFLNNKEEDMKRLLLLCPD